MKSSPSKAALFGASCAVSVSANAAVVFHDFPDQTLNAGNPGTNRLYFDLEGGTFSTTGINGVTDLVFSVSSRSNISEDGIRVAAYDVDYGILSLESSPGSFGEYALNLPEGAVIGGEGGSNLGNGGEVYRETGGADLTLPGYYNVTISGGENSLGNLSPDNNFAVGDSGFLGIVKYTFADGAVTATNYGFIEIEIGSLTIKSSGYDPVSDPAAGVTVVPEASSLSLLAMGLGGMAGYRRRRTANR